MMQDRIVILGGIARGKTAILEGRTLSNSQAEERLAKWLK